MSEPSGTPSLADPPSLLQLFTGFLAVGVFGFGGVLPLARRMLVEQRRWLAPGEFTDLLALCQFLPGGNVINLSAAVGLRFRGLAGALAALAGLMIAPVIVVVLLGLVYTRFESEPIVRRLFAGLAAAAAGLVVAIAVKIALTLERRPAAIVIALLSFSAVAILRLQLLPVMLVLVPISILVSWLAYRRRPA